MRILIVTQYFWPENFRVNDLSLFLNNLKNFDVTILTGEPNYPKGKIYKEFKKNKKKFLKYKNIKIIRVPIIPRGNNYFTLSLNYLSFIISCIIFGFKRLENKKFEKVFFFGTSPIFSALPAILYSKKKKIPLAIWLLDLWPQTLYQFKFFKFFLIKQIITYIVSKILNSFDIIFTQSPLFKAKINNLLKKKKKIIYLPAWYETIYLRKKISINKRKVKRIVFAGNLGEAQNLKKLIIKLQKLRSKIPIKFFFIGNGRSKKWIKNYVTKNNLTKKIIISKSYPNYKMPNILNCADYLMISLKKNEPFNLTIPGKLQNYMILGKPIISFTEGITNKIIADANCGYFADIDKLNINKFFKQILRNKNIKKMSNNSINYAKKNFDKNKIIKNLIKNF